MAAITNVSAGIGPGPYTNAFAVTKSDSTVFSPPTRALYVGGAGNIAVTMNDGTGPIVFTAVPVGTIIELSVSQVLSTSTTATLIVGLR